MIKSNDIIVIKIQAFIQNIYVVAKHFSFSMSARYHLRTYNVSFQLVAAITRKRF